MRGKPETVAARISIDVVEDDGDWSHIPEIAGLVEAAATAVAASSVELSADASATVALSSDTNVARLNGQFRGKPKPTNVLSFPAGKPATGGFLGDIVLARETIEREAREQETPLTHHIQHLVVHGLLHLLGYDHEQNDTAETMEAIEISVLRVLGIANPYTGDLERDTNC